MTHQAETSKTLEAREMRRIRGLLRETANMAKEASLTGSLRDGGRASVQQYNTLLEYLEDRSVVSGDLFRHLPDDANFDEVGIAAAQLAGYLVEDEAPPPPRDRHDHPKNVHVQIGNMPDLQELRGLGQKIREQVLEQVMRDRDQLIREWKSGWDPAGQPHSDQPSAPPVPPAPPTPPAPPPAATPRGGDQHRISEQLQALAKQLQKGDLTEAERADLAGQLMRLSQEQASATSESGSGSANATTDKTNATQRLG